MLRLKNVKINNDYAEADYYPEDGQKYGHVVVTLSDGKIKSITEVKGFGESYVSHTRKQLVKMAEKKDTRKECLIMWY